MSSLNVDAATVQKIGESLRDEKKPLKERFRDLFTLRNINNDAAIVQIGASFKDPSALLKHELAYCLGQMQNPAAVPILTKVLTDDLQQTIVRHEAAEALGAVGLPSSLELLEKYRSHEIVEIAETCELAVERIKWLQNNSSTDNGPYSSVDPAPPLTSESTEQLTAILLDENEKLFQRYRAMFALRNKGGEPEILALCKGLTCRSALFRHEIAFVLGQMANPASVSALKQTLADRAEQGMVRHECAEALGAIANNECLAVLKDYAKDSERVVRESCDIALDMCDYENSDQFQYADSLSKV